MTGEQSSSYNTAMNSIAAYALSVELAGRLKGRSLTGTDRFYRGITLSFDCEEIPFIHLIQMAREASITISASSFVHSSATTPFFDSIKGSKVMDIKPLGLDRAILIYLDSPGEWGMKESFCLRLDLSPGLRAASLFHLPDGKLYGSFGSRRSRPPSSIDDRPPDRRWSLLDLPRECPDLFSMPEVSSVSGPGNSTLKWKSERDAAAILVGTVSGIDPGLAKALVARFGTDPATVWERLAGIGRSLASGEFEWFAYDLTLEAGGGRAAYPVNLPLEKSKPAPTGFVELFHYLEKEDIRPDYIDTIRKDVKKIMDREIKRSKKLLSNIDADLENASKFREYRQFGNLLVTYRPQIKKGMNEITLGNFSGEGDVTIPLDPAVDPERNIQRYFRKARKGERGLLVIRNRRREIEKDISRRIKALEDIDNMDKVEQVLSLLPPPGDNLAGTGRVEEKRPFRRYPVDGKHTILVGRNDRENDELTHRFAAPSDLWFHAQGSPGSHVILKGADRSTPKRIIELAAAVAAWFSKARRSGTVAVVFTEKRYVRRPRKSRPGTAICQREKTLFVKPSLPDESGE